MAFTAAFVRRPMQRAWAVVAFLATVVLAGCLDDETTSGNVQPGDSGFGAHVEGCTPGTMDADGVNLVLPSDNVIPVDDEGDPLDPWDFSTTNYRTCTLTKVGHHELREGDPHNYLGELDMRGDLNLGTIAALGNGEIGTVYLLDITDRANPEVLSSITQDNTYIVDVKISDDGDFLFTASQNLPAPPNAPSGEGAVPVFAGFTIYDITDRSNPTLLQTVPSTGDIGCHMITHEIIDGTDVVFCVSQQIEAHGMVRQAAGPWTYLGPLAYFIDEGSGATSDLPTGCINDEIVINLGLGQASALPGGVAGVARDQLCSGPHDMTVLEDIVDGRIYMTVSHWNEGVRIVDVTKPLEDGFVEVAWWDGAGATHYDGNVHTAMMFWVGDARYVVASPEMTYGGVVPSLWILDATSLDGELELIAEWYHPTEFVTPGLLMTTHQWQVAPAGVDANVDDTNIYITMNHNGLWVLDFERILAGDLAGAIGGFHMSRAPLNPDEEVGAAVYSTWDVNVVDGYIYGSDRATGLWVFHYEGDVLGNERLRGTQ